MDLSQNHYHIRVGSIASVWAGVPKQLHLAFVAMVILLGVACGKKDSKPLIDPTLTLAASDSAAMGACVFQYFYRQVFDNPTITTNIRPFDRWYRQQNQADEAGYGNKQVYCAVAPALKIWQSEADAMADFVEQGNVLLLVSNSFSANILDKFGLDVEQVYTDFRRSGGMKDTYKTWSDTVVGESAKYGFYYYPLDRQLENDSTLPFNWLSRGQNETPDAIRVKLGKGELVLATNAAAFTNYFLLQGQNHQYALNLLSYLPQTAASPVWDDFYRRYPFRQDKSQSLLSSIMANPHLRMAMLVLLLAALAWIVTNLFRAQRKIALLKPNTNTSLEFSQTIARLYFNRKDNHNIAQKMLVYFNDWLHQKYLMHPGRYDEQFVNSFSAKSGMPLHEAELLASTIHSVQHSATVSSETLLRLNQQIQMAMAAQPG
ncbi:MAG: hypothetical protein EAY75_11745 [Bacteroidetes bacterium]|nr:MAG: hypothetical protein EAY75_11745 [Bacteroidota bacterium]